MKNHWLTVFLILGAVLTFNFYNVHHQVGSANAIVRIHQNYYRQYSTRRDRLRIVARDEPIWQAPHQRGVRRIGNTREIGIYRTVHLDRGAVHKNIKYYKISRQGRIWGWVNAHGLKYSSRFRLPFRYTSQYWPSAANDACEAAALKMALSVKGKAVHVSLHRMVQQIPRNSNPERGYTHNPFRIGSGATIYPRALARVARQYHVHARSITGASKNQLIYDVVHGDPVVFEGSFKMMETNSDHSLTLLGYRPGYFYYADPLSRYRGHRITGWVRTNKFMRIFTARRRGARALLIS